MKLVIVRHGETLGNVRREFESSENFAGSRLTKSGILQVKTLAENLITQGHVEQVYSSPTMRTRETAQILGEKLNAPVVIVDELREIDCGEWVGQPVDEIRDRFPLEWKTRKKKPTHFCFPGGESLWDLNDRVVPFLDGLLKDPGPGTMLLVSHSTAITVILAYLCGWDLEAAWLDRRSYHPNSACSVLEFGSDGRGVDLTLLAISADGPECSVS